MTSRDCFLLLAALAVLYVAICFHIDRRATIGEKILMEFIFDASRGFPNFQDHIRRRSALEK